MTAEVKEQLNVSDKFEARVIRGEKSWEYLRDARNLIVGVGAAVIPLAFTSSYSLGVAAVVLGFVALVLYCVHSPWERFHDWLIRLKAYENRPG